MLLCRKCGWNVMFSPPPPPPSTLTPLLSLLMWLLLICILYKYVSWYNCSTSVGTTSQIGSRNVKQVCSEPTQASDSARRTSRSARTNKRMLSSRGYSRGLTGAVVKNVSLPVEGKQCLSNQAVPVRRFDKERERTVQRTCSSVGCTNQEFSPSCHSPASSKLFRSCQLSVVE